MELIVFLLIFILLGIALAIGLCFLRQWRPTPLPWPIFVFVLLLGVAAANIGGVCFGGADALISTSSGGFLSSDQFDVVFQGLVLGCIALPGLFVSLWTLRVKDDRITSAAGSWVWGWLLSQSMLDLVVLFLGIVFSFRTFPDGDGGLPLWGYLVIMGLLTTVLGYWFGSRWGRNHSVLAPLSGLLALLVVSIALLALMCTNPGNLDPTWGLSLIQCSGGSWYALLFTPSAVLLGEYQYAWNITKLGLLASALAPHVLFTLGYLAPKPRERGSVQ